jgi:hypothetical protein
MSSYALTPGQELEVSTILSVHCTTLAEKVARAVKDTAQHERGSVVTLSIKVAFDKETPDLINMEVQEKIKHPKSPNTDQTSWTDPEVEHAWKTSETPGQQRLPGA